MDKAEKILKSVVICIVVSVFIGLYYYVGHFTYITYNSQLNEVCSDYGYEKATDSRFAYPKEHDGPRKLLIECDDKLITNKNTSSWATTQFELKQLGSRWCASYDKWGSCEYHSNNYSTIILH